MSASFAVDTALLGPGILLCGPGSLVDVSPIVNGTLLAVSPEVTVPTTTLPTVVIQYERGPVAPVPSTPCTDGELRAADYSNGPFTTMGTRQDIITVTSSVPCRLDGYPTLQFGTMSHPIVVAVEHNGAVGHQASPKPVAVGTGTPASFLVQTVMGVAAMTMHCTGTKVMRVGIPGTTPSLSVSLPAGSFGPAWHACGPVRVTPFEQGDTLDQYA
jgi:hypothetical protein